MSCCILVLIVTFIFILSLICSIFLFGCVSSFAVYALLVGDCHSCCSFALVSFFIRSLPFLFSPLPTFLHLPLSDDTLPSWNLSFTAEKKIRLFFLFLNISLLDSDTTLKRHAYICLSIVLPLCLCPWSALHCFSCRFPSLSPLLFWSVLRPDIVSVPPSLFLFLCLLTICIAFVLPVILLLSSSTGALIVCSVCLDMFSLSTVVSFLFGRLPCGVLYYLPFVVRVVQ